MISAQIDIEPACSSHNPSQGVFFSSTFLVASKSPEMEDQHANHSVELDKFTVPTDAKERKR